jgi:hypothetical protein
MILLPFLFLAGITIASPLALDKAWYILIDPKSPDHVSQLYCATVGRGVTYLDGKNDTADIYGFNQQTDFE